MDNPVPASTPVLDQHHGIGGTYVVLEGGTRVPSDPGTGLPLPPAEQLVAEAPGEAGSVQVAKSRRKNTQE